MKLVSLVSVCLIAGLSGCETEEEEVRRFVATVQGKPATDFTLTSLAGEEVRLSQFRGKPVVLAFWAST